MKIVLIFRCPGEFSIERVFGTIRKQLLNENVEIKNVYAPSARANLWAICKNMIFIYKKCKDGIMHITGGIQYCALILPSKRCIVTYHDFGRAQKINKWKMELEHFLWRYLPIKRAKFVTTISEFSRKELIEKYPWAKEKIIVIHDPIDSDYIFTPKTFEIKCPIILHIGTRSNKNLERVIEALEGINCQLRIIGKLNSKQSDLLKQCSVNYTSTSGISDNQMVEEYKNCDIVSFPSLYEGFGMPIIEGQATGRIVITSNIDPMTEIGKNGAIFVDPTNVNSIKAGFKKAIFDSNCRNSIIENGLKNVRRFDKTIIANQYLDLYKKTLNQ